MDLETRFDEAMMNIYVRALDEANYNATRYHEMLIRHRGLATARILLNAPAVSEGYTALWMRHRLDLTVEALIFDNQEFHSLFDERELALVRVRLQQFGYPPASE